MEKQNLENSKTQKMAITSTLFEIFTYKREHVGSEFIKF